MRDPPTPPSRPRVLVVDDDELVRRSLGRRLGRQAEVLSAEGPGRARELLDGDPVDVVVSDHSMQGETGMSLLATVAARRPAAALVMFSAQPPPEAYRALDEGLLDALFRKPDEAVALVDFVLRAIAPPRADGGAGPSCEIDASALPLARMIVRRPPTDAEWAALAGAASAVVAAGAPYALVFEVAEGATLTPAQYEVLAEWQRRNRDAVRALCLGVALVGGPGPNRVLHAVVRHAGPLGVAVRRCASRDEALAWARGRLAAGGRGDGG
jgi:CheY-like chemotaxis protein